MKHLRVFTYGANTERVLGALPAAYLPRASVGDFGRASLLLRSGAHAPLVSAARELLTLELSRRRPRFFSVALVGCPAPGPRSTSADYPVVIAALTPAGLVYVGQADVASLRAAMLAIDETLASLTAGALPLEPTEATGARRRRPRRALRRGPR